jgi:ribosome maturation factor RimP
VAQVATPFFSMGNPKQVLLEKVEALVKPLLDAKGMDVVDLEFVHEHGQWILRFFLDKAGGITLDDCAEMSNALGNVLDETDPIPQAYSLEVSSPGIYRPLRKEVDYARFIGERVDIKLYAPQDGRRHFIGTLAAVVEGNVVVESDGQKFILPLSGVAKAHLDPEIEI